MESIYEANAKIFKALCDEKRLRILELLQAGEKCACILIEEMKMPQSTLSYHMKILCESGIVVGRPAGKWTLYSIDEQGSLHAVSVLKSITAQSLVVEESECCTR